MERQYKQTNEQINDLYIRRDQLTEEIESIRNELRTDEGENLATVTFLLTEPDKELVTETKKHFDSFGSAANIVVSMEKFPGEDGLMTVDEVKTLTKSGWELCIKASTGREVAYLSNMLKQAGLPEATSVLVEDSESMVAIKEQMKSLDIHVMFTAPDIKIKEDENIIRIPLEGYRTAGIKDRTIEAINNSETLALAVSPKGIKNSNMSDPYDETVFISMMTVIGKYLLSGDCKVTPATEAAKRYIERNAQLAYLYEKTGRSIEELEKEIESINAELENIHKN